MSSTPSTRGIRAGGRSGASARFRVGPPRGRGRIAPPGEPPPRAESLVLLLLGAATACAAGFPLVYALGGVPHRTQFLGLSLGLALVLLGAASVVTGKRLVVTEELGEDYPTEHVEEQLRLEQLVEESGSRITRKRLLLLGGGAAGAALGAALLTPAASLGPLLDVDSLFETPWRRGLRLVDEAGRVLHAEYVEAETFYTAYPEGVADRDQMGAPVVVARLDPRALNLPPERRGWAPGGIVAYSKICTHAGCAIALYRKPTFPALQPKPAFVCPCHYSTFDPATGGTVLFGPAGRSLPQLPLYVHRAGLFRGAGKFFRAVEPS